MFQCMKVFNGNDIYRHGEFQHVQQRDKVKQDRCSTFGITLIIIPYWWDKKIESLTHTIHLHRPDVDVPLLKGTAISEKMPRYRHERVQYCPKRGMVLPRTGGIVFYNK